MLLIVHSLCLGQSTPKCTFSVPHSNAEILPLGPNSCSVHQDIDQAHGEKCVFHCLLGKRLAILGSGPALWGYVLEDIISQNSCLDHYNEHGGMDSLLERI